MPKTLQGEIIVIQLVSLRARRAAAKGYSMNKSMYIEVDLLQAQIEALEMLFEEIEK